jgi:hypothetical protein
MIPGTVTAPFRTSSFDGGGADSLGARGGGNADLEFPVIPPGNGKGISLIGEITQIAVTFRT